MKRVILYTAGTPNGQKVTNFTEELKAIYPDLLVDYHPIDVGQNEQKQDWFLQINPNGRIPALQDPKRSNHSNHCVFETASMLLYLEKHYDPNHVFNWSEEGDGVDRRSEVLWWMMLVHGGVGAKQGEANHFVRYATEEVAYAKTRYVNETKRLYRVLDSRLSQHDWLVGDRDSIGDMNAYAWLEYYKWAGLHDQHVAQSVREYIDRNWERRAVRQGIKVGGGNTDIVEKMRSKHFLEKYAHDAKKKPAQASKWIQDGMKNDRESKA